MPCIFGISHIVFISIESQVVFNNSLPIVERTEVRYKGRYVK